MIKRRAFLRVPIAAGLEMDRRLSRREGRRLPRRARQWTLAGRAPFRFGRYVLRSHGTMQREFWNQKSVLNRLQVDPLVFQRAVQLLQLEFHLLHRIPVLGHEPGLRRAQLGRLAA